VASVAEGLGEEKLVGTLAGDIGECGADGDNGLVGMAGVDGGLASGRPPLAELQAVGREGSEEEECDEKQDYCDDRKTEERQGIAEDQPSLQARIVFCLEGHKANRKSSCRLLSPVYGFDAYGDSGAAFGESMAILVRGRREQSLDWTLSAARENMAASK
jgi:hypothetical protein